MIFLNYLCEYLSMDKNEIIKFTLTAPHRYKTYLIPKRNSTEKRVISQPSKELKFIQRITIAYLKELLPVHDSAYAYIDGRSIKDNAAIHLKTRYLLKMDFKDFFPSITPDLFFRLVAKHGVNVDELDNSILRNIIFYKRKKNSPLTLSIGAPSSPFISNSIMYLFDDEIKKRCNKEKINYTRYADDLTFSSNKKNILFSIPRAVEESLKKHTHNKIKINQKKTIFSSKRHNRHVTGVTITNDSSLSIGRSRKRLISSMIHKFLNNLVDEEHIFKLQGLFSFATYIEPNFRKRMELKYGEENIAKLIKYRP